jgi:hypothetical protein
MSNISTFCTREPQSTDGFNKASPALDPAKMSCGGIPHKSLLAHLSETATALKEQQILLQQQRGPGGQRIDSGIERVCQQARTAAAVSSSQEMPVVYSQWHPEVTVLFADICGYTAMSTSVEPEQVRALESKHLYEKISCLLTLTR